MLNGITALLFVSALTSAHAENESCAQQAKKFCSSEAETKAVFQCLKAHELDLSTECKEEIERRSQAVRQGVRRGGGALSSFGGMSAFAPPVRMLSYEGRIHPQSSLYNQHRLNFSTPVSISTESSLSASVATGTTHLGPSAHLDSGLSLPLDLYRVEVGAQYSHSLPDKKNWGVRGSIGYAGDHLFNRFGDTSFTLNAHYVFSASENSFWAATVFLGNNTSIGNYIPIPGILYFYKNDHFTGMFGFPIISLQWTPAEPWSLGFSAFGPTLNTEIAYGEITQFQIFQQLGWTQQNFILRDRTRSEDRLTLEEKKASLGVRTPIFERVSLETQVGRSFDRKLYEGKGLFNKEGGFGTAESDWFVSAGLRAFF